MSPRHPYQDAADDAARSSPADRARMAGRDVNRHDRESLRAALDVEFDEMGADEELDELLGQASEIIERPDSVRSSIIEQMLPGDMMEDERSDRQIASDYIVDHSLSAATVSRMRQLANSSQFRPTGDTARDVRTLHRLARRR